MSYVQITATERYTQPPPATGAMARRFGARAWALATQRLRWLWGLAIAGRRVSCNAHVMRRR